MINIISNLICTKNQISYIVFDHHLKVVEYNETVKNISDNSSSLQVGTDIRDLLWEMIGLEDELEMIYNNTKDSLSFPMILKAGEYYDLDIEIFLNHKNEKLFIAYATKKQNESLAYINMVQEINKKTLIYESSEKKEQADTFDLINQKLLSFNVDMDGLITSVNNAFLLFFDKAKNEVVSKHFSTFFKARSLNLKANATIIFNAINTKKEVISFHANIIPLMREEVVYENTIICQDITYLKQIEKELQFAASHDALTGLPNRSRFLQTIDEAIETAKENHVGFSICIINLDQFNVLNETYGYHAGDMVLKHLAKILSDLIREKDLVSRSGGDEFLIFFNALDDKKYLQQMEQRILELPSKHPLVYTQDDIINFTYSLSFVSFPQDGQDTLSLIKKSKKKLHTNKQKK